MTTRKLLLALMLLTLSLTAARSQVRRAERAGRVTLSGHITDAASGETLIGAGVLDAANAIPTGAVTNEFGFYTLTLPPGPHSLRVAYIGYEEVVLEIDLQRDTTLDFALQGGARLEAAQVVSRKDAGLQSVYLGSIEVPLAQIQNAPTLFGEADVIKSLQLLPGVQGVQEGLAGLHVRGGGPDENLVLLDGVPMYNIDHLLGLFSVFQSEAVKNVTLYKGAFPARYGGRISSIVDIRTNDGNMKETHGSLTIGMVNDKFHLEGPILKDRLSYSVSARGLHTILLQPLIRLIQKDARYNYYFYDLNGKLTWRVGARDRLYFSIYHGADNGSFYQDRKGSRTDVFDIGDGYNIPLQTNYENQQDIGLNWGSTVGALRWNHIFGSRLFANTTLSVNRYRAFCDFSRIEKGNRGGIPFDNSFAATYSSGIFDLGARMDFDWTPTPDHLVKFGAEFIRHDFSPEARSANTDDKQTLLASAPAQSKRYIGTDLSLYAEDNIQIGTRLTLNPGLHFSWFSTQGRDYLSLQPRLSVKYTPLDGFSVKAGYSRMAQCVHLLSSTAVALPLDLWVPITADIRPVVADQYSLGLYYDGLKGWEFSLEGYWKEMDNLLEYKEGVVFLANSVDWEKQVSMGRGRSRGIELFVQKTTGKTTGWIAYTLAWSDRWFPDGSINMGRPFPYKYDRRHNINIIVNHKFSEKVDVSASWVFSTGSAMTLPVRQTAVLLPDDNWVQQALHVDSRNGYRLPPTHRLNLSVNLRHRTRRNNEVVWNLGVYNAYNTMNPNFILYGSDPIWGKVETTEDSLPLNKLTFLPILPAFSYTLNF